MSGTVTVPTLRSQAGRLFRLLAGHLVVRLTMRDTSQTRRRRIFVEPTVQTAVAVRLVMLWVATLAMSACVSVLMAFFSNPSSSFLAHLTNLRHWMPSIVAFLAIAPLAVLNLLRFTHRFAGPVHRLRNELRRLAAGEEVPPLEFRKRDYWKTLANDFNDVAELVRQSRVQEGASTPTEVAEPEVVS